MKASLLRVVKVGGSLFSCEQLPRRLTLWLEQQPGISVLIAGGGALADWIRAADDRFDLGERDAHRMCLRAMRVSAEMLAALLENAPLVSRLDQLPPRTSSPISPVVLDAGAQLLATAPDELPETWQVTSDSIAAHFATTLAADELVLLKSCDLAADRTREEAAREDFVDAYFPRASANLQHVRWVNLRSDPPRECWL